ncbi:hypothetical protein BaRGS_00021825 [Batillaria attramentaria]|uniref:Uncharacterized protein n=1 Tax=Batillaria attramentaria TaxID=370345 RepID=A0ABD0KI54_9CAEN
MSSPFQNRKFRSTMGFEPKYLRTLYLQISPEDPLQLNSSLIHTNTKAYLAARTYPLNPYLPLINLRQSGPRFQSPGAASESLASADQMKFLLNLILGSNSQKSVHLPAPFIYVINFKMDAPVPPLFPFGPSRA